MAGYLGTQYTQDQINAVPFLANAVQHALISGPTPGSGTSYMYGDLGGSARAQSLINSAMADPNAYVENQLQTQVSFYAQGLPGTSITDIQNAEQYLANNGVSASTITSDVNAGIQSAENTIASQSSGGFLGQLLSNPTALADIAAAFAIPGMAAEIAPSLATALGVSTTTATAVASAIGSTALQVSQGVPVDTAVQNAAINSVVQTGSTEAAQALISNGNNPALTNAITSGVAGAVKTAAEGGNSSQILENAGAGAAASTAGTVAQSVGASPTVSNVIAGTVGGATQAGGNVGTALAGAAGGAGQSVIPSGSVPYITGAGNSGLFLAPNGYVYNSDGTVNQTATQSNLSLQSNTQANAQDLINAVQSQVGNLVTAPGTQVASNAPVGVGTPAEIAQAQDAVNKIYAAAGVDPNGPDAVPNAYSTIVNEVLAYMNAGGDPTNAAAVNAYLNSIAEVETEPSPVSNLPSNPTVSNPTVAPTTTPSTTPATPVSETPVSTTTTSDTTPTSETSSTTSSETTPEEPVTSPAQITSLPPVISGGTANVSNVLGTNINSLPISGVGSKGVGNGISNAPSTSGTAGGGFGSESGTESGTGTTSGKGAGSTGEGDGGGGPGGTGVAEEPISVYDPNLYIYGSAPKGLNTALTPIPSLLSAVPKTISGQTQGVGGGGAGGEVSVESSQPQKAVWNVQSLKLQPGAEEEEAKDFGNLSTALGI
jgi:hypothetical protein